MACLAAAQDKIYTTTQKTPIEGEVTEITVSEIKYRPVGRPTPIISLDKQDVVKIVYQSGEVFMINNPMKDFTIYSGQKRWIAKLDVLTPLVGHTRLFLEEARRPGRSAEYELNIIGIGKNPYITGEYVSVPNGYDRAVKFDARGAGIGYGMKFLRLPDYINGQIRLRHILQGSYVKPAVSFAYYTRNFVGFDPAIGNYLIRKPVYAANINTTFGKQWILDNTISLEVYGTVGYSFDNVRSNQRQVRSDVSQPFFMEDNAPFNAFGYTRFSSGDFGLAVTGGFRIGYLFNMKKKEKAQ